MFAFVVYCPHFFYSLVYITSIQSKFSPGPKNNTRTERKLLRSRPDPFSWPRTGPIPGLSKIWARDPSRVGVARSGPGIPDGPGCPARLYLRVGASLSTTQNRTGLSSDLRKQTPWVLQILIWAVASQAGVGGRVPPETSDREILADVSGKKRQGKKGKGVKIEKKRRKIVKMK